MRNLLITGGAGFIGSNYVHYHNSKYPKDNLIIFDKLTYAGNLENLKTLEGKKNYTFIKGDICDSFLLRNTFQNFSINSVINFAAESHVDRSISGPKDFIDTNIMGTFNLLEVTKSSWVNESNRLLHISTDEVYGSLKCNEDRLFTENSTFAPNSPYAASKAGSDHLVRAYHHTYGLNVVTTNCSNNFGPYQFPEKLIPLIIVNSLRGKPLPVYGDGTNVRDWLYVLDHCKAIDIVMKKGISGETYNVGGNNEWKNIDIVKFVSDLVDEICLEDKELQKDFPIKGNRRDLITFVNDRKGHDERYAIDSSKISSKLFWNPEESFESAMKKTVQWYLNNMEWWKDILERS